MKVHTRWLNVDGWIAICNNTKVDKAQKNLQILDYISFANGVFYYDEDKKLITFRPDRPDLEYANYKYSTDILNSDDPNRKRESFEDLVKCMEEEEFIVKYLLDFLNMYLCKFEPLVAKVILDRLILKMSVRDIMNKEQIYRKQYYKYYKTGLYYAKSFNV